MVYIGVFFPVYFDADKVFIHVCGHFFILKALSLHYVAPVACCIAYTHYHRLVFLLCFLKCLISPGIPVYGIVCVLQ